MSAFFLYVFFFFKFDNRSSSRSRRDVVVLRRRCSKLNCWSRRLSSLTTKSDPWLDVACLWPRSQIPASIVKFMLINNSLSLVLDHKVRSTIWMGLLNLFGSFHRSASSSFEVETHKSLSNLEWACISLSLCNFLGFRFRCISI